MRQILVKGQTQIPQACEWLTNWLVKGLEGGPVAVILDREGRTKEQNDKYWPMLADYEKQLTWPIQNGRRLDRRHWKLIMMSAYRCEPNSIVMGMHGEPVNLNLSTKKLNKKDASEFIEFLYAQGAEWNVIWSEPALKAYAEMLGENAK